MIRAIQPNELNKLISMAQQFWDEGQIPGDFLPSVFERNWARLIGNGHGRIFAYFENNEPVGAIGIIIIKDINNDSKIAEEAFWFVSESSRRVGIKLFNYAEKYAKSSGCKRMSMRHLISLQPEKLGAFYERNGYSCIEHAYIKIL